MRPMVIVCEQKDIVDLNHAISLFVHPLVRQTFVSFIVVDLSAYDLQSEKFKVTDACRTVPPGSTNSVQVYGTKEVGSKLSLDRVLSPFGISYQEHTRSMLCATQRDTPLMHQLLSNCGLTVRSAAAEMLQGWAHQPIDAKTIEAWSAQFNRLGKLSWLSKFILGSVRLVSPAQLGELLCMPADGVEFAITVNHDSRSHGKSGEVIANLISKRMQGAKVYENPADAVAAGLRKIRMYEDGLFTGTETIGVLESLLGERPIDRLKTKALKDPSKFHEIQLMMRYGIGTDYGVSVVKRFLAERSLHNVELECTNVIPITNATALANIDTGVWQTSDLWKFGPPEFSIDPHFLNNIETKSRLTEDQIREAREFCSQVGRQLFYNYTQQMKKRRADYRDWEDAKLDKCAFGMWGLGLTLTFGHSIPKASLPLLWGDGPVTYAGKRIDAWTPLFPNSW